VESEEDMLETIEQAVKPHDKYQFEIKLDYELLKGKKTAYQISTYIFVPHSLGINKNSYSKTDFYRDIQNYIRLKTPTFILRDFLENSTSPLALIEEIVAIENWATDPECKKRLIQNFKFLRSMLKSSIREHLNLIQKRIDEAPSNSKLHLIVHNLVEEFLIEAGKIADKYRSFYPVFNLPVDEQIFVSYQFTDESISLLIEEGAIELFDIVDTHLKKSHKSDFKPKLNALAEAEVKHRQAHGYRSVLQPDSDNEEYVFRASVLKKYASSVLYLSTAIRTEGRGLEHSLFALAAGLSMVFATVVAFYFQQKFGNFTFPFFVALVVGYMFKDRIKELVRSLFLRYLQNILYDRRIIIRTQDSKHKLGVLREKVYFVSEKDVPRTILVARNRDHITELDNEGQGEKVICYSKDIVLFTHTFKRIFADMPEITGINDIMRYDVRAYLRKMADPIQEKNYLEGEELKTVLCHKVYHLNLISKYKSVIPQKEKIYRRLRLILNRAGIKRIEQVPV
jgi:hypothetical protein